MCVDRCACGVGVLNEADSVGVRENAILFGPVSCVQVVFVQSHKAEPLGYLTVLKLEPTIMNQHLALTMRVRSVCQIIGKTTVCSS
jgi:hypothetical protein